MLHLENSGWSKVEQVGRAATLKSAPLPPAPVRGWVGGAVEQGRFGQVEQNQVVQATTPAEAKAVGSPTYFTGKPCNRGHIAPRYTASASCTKCASEGHYRGNPETRRKWQREANRRERLSRRGGCTPEIKANMIASQNGKCAICVTEAELFVDHCHDTDTIREALCRSCNLALGMAKDQPDLLRAMADYLDRHRA